MPTSKNNIPLCNHGRVSIFCNECFIPIMDSYMKMRLEQVRDNAKLLRKLLK